MLRPGNAGANTAADQIAVAADALDQLPDEVVERADILLRTDSAGATHELSDWARDGRIRVSVGLDLTEAVREAILQVPDGAWTPARCQDGEQRDGAWVAEITDRLDLGAWPERSRAIVRRERPTPERSSLSKITTATASWRR